MHAPSHVEPRARAAACAGAIGIWPFPSFGDGLIVLGLANSLRLSGYDVTVYSDALAATDALLPYRVLPRAAIDRPGAPGHTRLDALLVQRTLDDLPRAYHERAILYDYSQSELRRAGGAAHAIAPGVPFAHANGIAISRCRRHAPLALCWEAFARDVLRLPQVARTPGWLLGPDVVPRRHARRVVMHPEAGTATKRWPPERSLELARRLADRGWEPVLLLDARERERWVARYDVDVPVTELATFAEVVRFVAESGYFVGNDSGPGHVASSLGVPTLTILMSRRLFFYWRPGYTSGALVRSPGWWRFPRSKERAPPSVDRVLAHFERLVRDHPTPGPAVPGSR